MKMKTIKQIEKESIQNQIIAEIKEHWMNIGDISDWYHTFWELYKHRFHLYIALCKSIYESNTFDWFHIKAIRSKVHEDWLNVWKEWWMFLLVLHTDEWQISYHIDNEYWDKCDFAITEEKATIKWDWHTSDDVLERLLNI